MSLLLMLALAGGEAQAADNRGATFSLGGGWFFFGPEEWLQNSWTFVARPGYQLSQVYTIEADVGYLNGLTENGVSYHAWTPRLNLLLTPWRGARLEPFFAAGPGLIRKGINRDEAIESDLAKEGYGGQNNPDHDFLLNIGPGLRIPIGANGRGRFSLRADARYLLNVGFETTLDSGADNSDIYSDFELTAGFMIHPPLPPEDTDGDGILDADDDCISDPEDVDGYQDSDGCPDTDNDSDGILDADDSCPDSAEDMDGVEDEDGCPDGDNDGDGIVDAEDACPNVPGEAATKGCPDRDGDGIVDKKDKCPDDPGIPEKEGCPKVMVAADKIVILDKVFFETGSDVIKTRSHDLLDEVAKVIVANPQLRKIEIQGHTDNVGSDDYNLGLSNRRAASVKAYLVDKGVKTGKLTAKGYGEGEPISKNDTEEGRSENRRVEFVILEQDEVMIEDEDGGGEGEGRGGRGG